MSADQVRLDAEAELDHRIDLCGDRSVQDAWERYRNARRLSAGRALSVDALDIFGEYRRRFGDVRPSNVTVQELQGLVNDVLARAAGVSGEVPASGAICSCGDWFCTDCFPSQSPVSGSPTSEGDVASAAGTSPEASADAAQLWALRVAAAKVLYRVREWAPENVNAAGLGTGPVDTDAGEALNELRIAADVELDSQGYPFVQRGGK